MEQCRGVWLGLALTALTLLLSTCLNVFLCFLRRRNATRKVSNERLHVQAHQRQSTILAEELSDHFHDHDNHHVEQENPIYGNINTNVGDFDDVCHETMNKRQNNITQPVEPDITYASINLNMAQKRRKHKHCSQQGQTQTQTQTWTQDQLQAQLCQPLVNTTTPVMATFLEVETEEGNSLLGRNSSPVASSNSIYLNSQQLALEATEERDRERVVMEPRGWDGMGEWDRVEHEGGMGYSIGSHVAEGETQIVEMTHDDPFIGSFDHDNSLLD